MKKVSAKKGKAIFRVAVETCWSPLTPEHGFPSLSVARLRALPLSPLRLCAEPPFAGRE